MDLLLGGEFVADGGGVEFFECLDDVVVAFVEPESAFAHFADGVFLGPALVDDAVAGDDEACPVGATPAVDEGGFGRIF